uniref:hypothetical protein n=1 Tax=Mesoflavibacter profundi TaxID=2708110 RepID=UPI003514DBD8
GIPDVVEGGNGDLDTNDDGVIDANDNGYTDNDNNGSPDAAVNTNPDTDGDGIPNYQDLDSDNDGLNDEDESGASGEAVDTDGDTVPDYLDLDSDNDGINDVIEGGNATLDTNNDGTINSSDTGGTDNDNDGVTDVIDSDGGTVYGDAGNPSPQDTDADGIPDYQDLDSDDDGVNDIEEAGTTASDSNGNSVLDGPDTDGDGIVDGVDQDINNFGDAGNTELPSNNVSDPTDANSGGTGVVSDTGVDADNDGIADSEDNDDANFGDPSVSVLSVKVMLQGALLNTSNGLMRTDLLDAGYLPLTEPYSTSGNTKYTVYGNGGGETTTTQVLNANSGTQDAIVDWIFIELRNENDNTIIEQTKAALLQSDGDVVSPLDGVSPVTFEGVTGNYFISIKHRNHLGVMTASPVQLSANNTVVDFTIANGAFLYDIPGSVNYDGNEQITVGSVKALHAGNLNGDNQVGFKNGNSDLNKLQIDVLLHPNNSTFDINFDQGFGYFDADMDLDGKVSFSASNSDINKIQLVILLYPLNTSFDSEYDLLIEQLP